MEKSQHRSGREQTSIWNNTTTPCLKSLLLCSLYSCYHQWKMLSIYTPVAFVTGGLFSMLAGFIDRKIASASNARYRSRRFWESCLYKLPQRLILSSKSLSPGQKITEDQAGDVVSDCSCKRCETKFKKVSAVGEILRSFIHANTRCTFKS